MPTEIAHPFHVGSDGKITTVSDPDVQVRQHVLALINTEPGERLMQPEYGVPSQQFSFEIPSDEISIRLGTLIEDAFATWEPGVRMVNAIVPPSPQFEMETLDRVEVQYQRLDSPDVSAAPGTNTVIISAAGTVKEIIRG